MSNSLQPKTGFKVYIITNIAFILLLLWIIIFYGCASSKPLEKSNSIENNIDKKSDSSKITEINKSIIDTFKIKVPTVKTTKPECDSITQAALDQVLRQLNISNHSGSNGAGIYYDESNKNIVAWQKVGESKNTTTAVNKKENVSSINKSIEIIKVPFVPLWVKVLASIGVLTIIFIGFRISRIWF